MGSARTVAAWNVSPSTGHGTAQSSCNDRDEGRCVGFRVPGKIHIPSGPIQRLTPDGEEHRSLENELFPVPGRSEPVQEALRDVALESEVEVLPAVLRTEQEPRLDRGSEVLELRRHDAMDSK
jgi:hypothetical protein